MTNILHISEVYCSLRKQAVGPFSRKLGNWSSKSPTFQGAMFVLGRATKATKHCWDVLGCFDGGRRPWDIENGLWHNWYQKGLGWIQELAQFLHGNSGLHDMEIVKSVLLVYGKLARKDRECHLLLETCVTLFLERSRAFGQPRGPVIQWRDQVIGSIGGGFKWQRLWNFIRYHQRSFNI